MWTTVDDTQAACGTCHGVPPPPPHTSVTACGNCHPTASGIGVIVDPSRHVDGVVDVEFGPDATCASCHGTAPLAPSPPPALDGSTDTADRGVGAHATHLGGSGEALAVACEECHIVPTELLDAGHFDSSLPAEVTFPDDGLARGDGATPAYDADALSCSGAYCHGGTLGGGTLTEPTWTTVDGTQTTCGTCHGLPPPPPHPPLATCGDCHPTDAPDVHVNGTVDLEFDDALACNACHGTDAAEPAPPPAVDGSTATSVPGVGAHAAHLEAPVPIPCADCHEAPASVSAPSHIDGEMPAEVPFPAGSLARNDGAVPAYDAATATCSGVYCHGATLSGGTTTAPAWTTVDGSQAACGTCHGTPPPGPHPLVTECLMCHPTATGPGVIVDPLLHVNGVIDCQPLIPCD